ncbi:MAG TPA: hypothetical protein VD789_02085 [Thermomicrobiales bacterium]|nr:hypothetical protein [Thermomicrobiales bacterium]
MSDPIRQYRPESDSKAPQTSSEWHAELERLEAMVEQWREEGVEDISDVERRINEIRAMIDAKTDGPNG